MSTSVSSITNPKAAYS
ncbi:uncharacterized protein FFFS_13186 [Fusarium fujikuroi]|nr:uncharacterized protein FFFS_13186 [Fusarium fujikuroi]